MKLNGNDTRISDYYLGLDVGTNSVGWAVTDKDYNILKFKGNAMWGIRLFDEAQTAKERRLKRTGRRRLERRKQRLNLLEMLFNNEIMKIDPLFFIRLHNSSLMYEDKDNSKGDTGKYSLFNDDNYCDRDYLKEYPTIYHLRQELIHSDEPHDARLVFLALHQIMKNRGHFLFETDTDDGSKTMSQAVTDFVEYLFNAYNITADFTDREKFEEILGSADLNISTKKKLLKENVIFNVDEEIPVDPLAIIDLISGATVKLSQLYCDDSLKDAEKKSVSLKGNIEDDYDVLNEILEDRVSLIVEAKTLFDVARLSQILGKHEYISDAKVELYNKNHKDLRTLKQFVREFKPDSYRKIFYLNDKEKNNFAAYSKYKTGSGDKGCTQEEFCKYLLTELKKPIEDNKENVKYSQMINEINNKTFITKLAGIDNGVIPNQLHRKELVKIIRNASKYLDFLNFVDSDGIKISDKLISVFDFKVPYYVGPLNTASPKHWVIRKDDKIYPWNFEKVVDTEKSAQQFIINLIAKCTYTGYDVIPKDSLLYSEYAVLNEINPLKVNGKPITVKVKQDIYNDLFVQSSKTVTKKSIKSYLLSKGLITKEDEISGVDDIIKSKLKSYHDFKAIIDRTGDKVMVDDIIQSILVFGDDKKMLKKWISKNNYNLEKDEIEKICRLKYKDWGRLSKEFLTEIYSPDDNGVAVSIIETLRSTNNNLMQLLSDDYKFSESADEILKNNMGADRTIHDMLDDMYITPSVKRSIWQSLRIVDEIVDIKKSAPKKVFVEVARGSKDEMKKRTKSRKESLVELYKNCNEESNYLFEKLQNEPENMLRKDALYLYYTQFGKCIYSGEDIDLELLLKGDKYDIDHIYPQSKIKDNSLNNRVLVKKELNRDKTNEYPIKSETRNKMYSFWKELSDKKLISEDKFLRLVRSTPLTEDELSSFVARQLVTTQQSTKAIATVLQEIYPKEMKVVYSKAGNVSDFKQEYDIIKCREVNDLHHAKDAYLNIVVGNVYDTKFTKNFFLNISKENYSLNRVFDYDTPGAWDKDKTIKKVKEYISKNNIRYTRMPHEVKGLLFDLQIMPAGKGQLEIKNGMDIEKYGGYNKVSGTYFFVVEHTEKGKRVRSIETVYLYKKSLYESDPIKYCTEILHLENPLIIVEKMLVGSFVEINNKRLSITGRTGKQYVCQHTYQFCLDQKHEEYIKCLLKYIERCNKANEELVPTAFENINADDNKELYDWFVERLKNKPYYALLGATVLKTLENSQDIFNGLSILEQSKILSEVLKAFKCDRQSSDLSLLNFNNNNENINEDNIKSKSKGKGIGSIYLNKSLAKTESAFLINQSVTGLFETKKDLLK